MSYARIFSVCAGFLMVMIFFPVHAFSEHREMSYTLSPHAGVHVFEGDDYDDAPAAGLGFGYNYTQNFGVELDYSAIFTENNTGKGDTLGHMYRLEGLYHFPLDEKWSPFLAGGVGGLTYDHDDDDTDTYALLSYGAGLLYFLSDELALRGDIRHIILSHDEPRNSLLATLGLSYYFGGPGKVDDVTYTVPTRKPLVTEEVPTIDHAARDVCLVMAVRFDFDRVEIKAEYVDDLDAVGNFIRNHPEFQSATISGHADSIGTEVYNLGLAKRRAESIKQYLVEKFGFDSDFFVTRSLGEFVPVAPNTSEEGRALNRRAVSVTCHLERVVQ